MRLAQEFGPHDAWGGAYYPPGKRKQLDRALQQMADYFGLRYGVVVQPSAIEQQYRWGITAQNEVLTSQYGNFLLNKAAAVEVGLVARSAVRPPITK